MITDHLDNTENYYSISKYFQKSFEFIKSLDKNSTIGLHKIDSNLNAYVMEYWTSKEFVHGWESHRKYIDIQYCLIGKERIQWTYKNEDIIGIAIKESVEEGVINSRDELFITSKLHRSDFDKYYFKKIFL